MLKKLFLLLIVVCVSACNSSAVKDAIDLIEGVPRKDIDTTRLGVNAFVNDARFGSASQQMAEIQSTIRLSHVRVLMAWTDLVQPTRSSNPAFSFFDEVLDAVPAGLDALVVVTGLPAWMTNSANWIEGNPRTTFVELWLRKVVQRYGNHPRVVGFEVWNEPNMLANGENTTLDMATKPENYVEMLARASNIIKTAAPGKLVISAATTAIAQNYPDTLEYNRALRDAGVQAFSDIYGMHYYGKNYENFITGGGVEDYLNGLTNPIWVTESGVQGATEQLGYGEEVWPFLLDRVAGIQRIYQYQFAEATPASGSFGMRTLDAVNPVSDLYIFLRDRP